MPLDFDLITNSIAHSRSRLESRISTESSDLFFLTDFLYPPLLEKLMNMIKVNDLVWKKVWHQEYVNRLEVNWLPDTAIEETHIVIESLTEDLHKIWGKQRKFLGISVWKDTHPYKIEPHSDQSLIGYSIQIYLNCIDVNLSTQFKFNESVISPNYLTNSGYIMNNDSKIPHWMMASIPEDFVRYSLYASWTDI